MTAAYRLNESHTLGDTSYEAGLTVYRCTKYDYGCSSEDTRHFGVEHWSMTLDPTGDYPYFTVPVTKLVAVPAEPAALPKRDAGLAMAQTMADNEERRFRDRVGETEYARLKEIERTQGIAAARAEARRVEKELP